MDNTVFRWPVRVYWEDTDAGGIVFYANYLKFFERSRTEWLRSLGLAQQQLKVETGGMFVVTDSQIRYHRPARLDDELIVTASLQEAGRASLIIKQQVLLKTGQDPLTGLEFGNRRCSEGSLTEMLASAGNRVLPAASSSGATLICEGSNRIAWVRGDTMQASRIPSTVLDRQKPC